MEKEKLYWECIIGVERFPRFDLEKAVCNHGFFMMAPNHWEAATKCFSRPLRLADSVTSLMTHISQPSPNSHLLLRVYGPTLLSFKDQLAIQSQVRRMLRLLDTDEEDVRNFHKLLPQAEAKGFGRLFRSPTLFEDVAKSLLLRFCPWNTSLNFAKALCDIQQKRRKTKGLLPCGDFPSPEELAEYSEEELKGKYKLGFRARDLIILAKKVVAGKIKLSEFENDTTKLIKVINGVGPFTLNTINMCLGHYNNIPIDSETLRHMEEFHQLKLQKRKRGCTSQTRDRIQQIYKIYDPFQSLAYWFELVHCYETKLGKELSQLLPSEYRYVTANCQNIKKKTIL